MHNSILVNECMEYVEENLKDRYHQAKDWAKKNKRKIAGGAATIGALTLAPKAVSKIANKKAGGALANPKNDDGSTNKWKRTANIADKLDIWGKRK